MRTSDVRVNQQYLYNQKLVTVIKRIKGRPTTKDNMQGGVLFTGNHCMQKKFLLDSGEIVKAQLLTKI